MMERETASLDAHAGARARALLGAYEGCAVPTSSPAAGTPRRAAIAAAALGRAVAGAAAARGRGAQRDLFPEGRLDQDLQQVDLRERNSWRLLLAEVSSVELLEVQLVNAVAPFVLNARLKPLMLRDARARQAHRQRLGGRGAVLPALQDDPAPAHEHGEGRAEHDDAHLGGRLPRRRHPHEQRRHRLGHRRGPGARSPRARPRSTASTRRSTSSTAPRASSIRSSPASTPASTSGASSSRTTARPTGSRRHQPAGREPRLLDGERASSSGLVRPAVELLRAGGELDLHRLRPLNGTSVISFSNELPFDFSSTKSWMSALSATTNV